MTTTNQIEADDYENGFGPPTLSTLEFQQLLAQYKRAVYTNWLYPLLEKNRLQIAHAEPGSNHPIY